LKTHLSHGQMPGSMSAGQGGHDETHGSRSFGSRSFGSRSFGSCSLGPRGFDYIFSHRHGRGTILRKQAVSTAGKPLHGAAKNSFVKKCKKDACESKAVSAEGKPLHGAAKNSFMAKCKRDA
jgi:hypothetical protein